MSDIPVCVISTNDLAGALEYAPARSRKIMRKSLIIAGLNFWSAPVETFSRTRWSKIVKDKSMYRAITVRNANTTMKLADIVKEREQSWHGKPITKS